MRMCSWELVNSACVRVSVWVVMGVCVYLDGCVCMGVCTWMCMRAQVGT